MTEAPRRLGLIGGMSWESSAHYYRLINEGVRARRGSLASASLLLLASVDFAPVAALQHAGAWGELAAMLREEALALVRAGAGALVLCTNTMHAVADAAFADAGAPLLHIVDAATAAIAQVGLVRVGLLGTAFTMEQPFLHDRFAAAGIETLVPEARDRVAVHRVIYDELVRGDVRDPSRALYRDVMARLVTRGAEGIVLGCTEIMLLVGPGEAAVPLFDTTALHAAAASTGCSATPPRESAASGRRAPPAPPRRGRRRARSPGGSRRARR